VCVLASTHSPNIMAFIETRLDESIKDWEVSVESYQRFWRDRSGHDGGVSLYVSELLSVPFTMWRISWSSYGIKFVRLTV